MVQNQRWKLKRDFRVLELTLEFFDFKNPVIKLRRKILKVYNHLKSSCHQLNLVALVPGQAFVIYTLLKNRSYGFLFERFFIEDGLEVFRRRPYEKVLSILRKVGPPDFHH